LTFGSEPSFLGNLSYVAHSGLMLIDLVDMNPGTGELLSAATVIQSQGGFQAIAQLSHCSPPWYLDWKLGRHPRASMIRSLIFRKLEESTSPLWEHRPRPPNACWRGSRPRRCTLEWPHWTMFLCPVAFNVVVNMIRVSYLWQT
jgi:hypothetical protein